MVQMMIDMEARNGNTITTVIRVSIKENAAKDLGATKSTMECYSSLIKQGKEYGFDFEQYSDLKIEELVKFIENKKREGAERVKQRMQTFKPSKENKIIGKRSKRSTVVNVSQPAVKVMNPN